MYTIDLSQAYYSMIGTSAPVDMDLYDKNRKAYLANLNDADISVDYVRTLAETLEVRKLSNWNNNSITPD